MESARILDRNQYIYIVFITDFIIPISRYRNYEPSSLGNLLTIIELACSEAGIQI